MRLKLFIILLLSGMQAFCQEQLLDLQYNPLIREKLDNANTLKSQAWYNDTTPVFVPFFDDFSASDVYPSPDRWADRYGFENAEWPVNPINLGVLTMDAINDSGSIYPDGIPGPTPFIADYLTSRYIRLDSLFSPSPRALSPADSVYLSFFYQPQGIGSAPKNNDSLVLQFLAEPAHDSISPVDTTLIPDRWIHIWSTKGMPLDTFFLQNNSYFKRVSIPITDSVFFKKSFRFQFYNYVSLASNSEPSWQSNCCQWNLDNIYLNTNRSYKDTIYSEIRFIYPPPSMLKRYQAMPYTQYCDDPTEEMTDTISVTFRNRDSITHTVSYRYEASYQNGSVITTYTPEEDLVVRPYYKYNDLTVYPPVQFLFPIDSKDSAAFIISHYVNDITPGSGLGDTIKALQKFYNYYAYDDGTPEKGYGLTKAGSRMAYRFRLNKADTLRGVGVYFNKTLSGVNQQFFYLVVWSDNNGKPGDTVYSELVYVRFSENLNQFVTYRFTRPVKLTSDFYVGMITTTDDNLNLGFDRYINSQDNLFYNSTGEWNTSAFTGSLLLRPLLGKPIPLGTDDPEPKPLQLLIYPNPCSGEKVTIEAGNLSASMDPKENLRLIIRDLFGRELVSAPWTRTVDVAFLTSGMYLVEVRNTGTGRYLTGKLLIAR